VPVIPVTQEVEIEISQFKATSIKHKNVSLKNNNKLKAKGTRDVVQEVDCLHRKHKAERKSGEGGRGRRVVIKG
jgi:hypothetical protein